MAKVAGVQIAFGGNRELHPAKAVWLVDASYPAADKEHEQHLRSNETINGNESTCCLILKALGMTLLVIDFSSHVRCAVDPVVQWLAGRKKPGIPLATPVVVREDLLSHAPAVALVRFDPWPTTIPWRPMLADGDDAGGFQSRSSAIIVSVRMLKMTPLTTVVLCQ